MKVEIELDDLAYDTIILDSLKWHLVYGDQKPKLQKAFRTVLKYYMTHAEWEEFKEHE